MALAGLGVSGRAPPHKAALLVAGLDACDIRIDRTGLSFQSFHAPTPRPKRLQGVEPAALVAHLMRTCGIQRVRASAVGQTNDLSPQDPFRPLYRQPATVWFVVGAEQLDIFTRHLPAVLPAPIAPIPATGPWALPAPAPHWKDRSRTFADNTITPVPCPRCQEQPERFRDLGARWVCPLCGRSFASNFQQASP